MTSVAGVPLPSPTLNHAADEAVVNDRLEPPAAVIERSCAAGALPPCNAEKLKLVGDATSVSVTFSVTEMELLFVNRGSR